MIDVASSNHETLTPFDPPYKIDLWISSKGQKYGKVNTKGEFL
jgi:hypothetical protein